jgi:hypothetical protein
MGSVAEQSEPNIQQQNRVNSSINLTNVIIDAVSRILDGFNGMRHWCFGQNAAHCSGTGSRGRLIWRQTPHHPRVTSACVSPSAR